jgi:hypothetical protein
MRPSRKRKPKKKGPGWSSVLGAVGIVILAGAVVAFVASMLLGTPGGPEEEPIVLKEVRVQVLNGCGVRGAGREVANSLRLKGYDVIDVGNADTFDYLETLVIERQKAGGRAVEVARALGVDTVLIQRVDGSPYDATVIIGKDFKTARPQ